ncbi:hypothetical protein D3C76_966570 [compost metagenome]
MHRCLQCLARVATDVLRGGDPVGLYHQLAEYASTFVLTSQNIQQAGPQRRKATEPIEDRAVENLGVEQACGGAVQVVVATFEVVKTVGLIQWTLPGVPKTAILAFDQQVHGNLADVME